MIVTAMPGFMTNFENVKSNFIVFFKEVIAMLNATKWHATEAHAAPFTPIPGIGTRTKFRISFTNTPTP